MGPALMLLCPFSPHTNLLLDEEAAVGVSAHCCCEAVGVGMYPSEVCGGLCPFILHGKDAHVLLGSKFDLN